MLRRFLLLAFTLFSVSVAAAAAEPVQSDIADQLSSYKLGAGDVISIKVLGEEELNREKVRLSDAGTISFPVLGELRVEGMTIGNLERIITDKLKAGYLVNPRVFVQLDEYRPVFVNGMVEKPGGYAYQPGLTVRKAASLAGGLKERASKSGIYIIRSGDSSQKAVKVDLNAEVLPGDTIIIEQSFF